MKNVLLQPTVIKIKDDGGPIELQYSLHEVPRLMLSECKLILPDVFHPSSPYAMAAHLQKGRLKRREQRTENSSAENDSQDQDQDQDQSPSQETQTPGGADNNTTPSRSCGDQDVETAAKAIAAGPLLVIPTFQKVHCSMSEFTPESAKEKDRLLESYFRWGNLVGEYIRNFKDDEDDGDGSCGDESIEVANNGQGKDDKDSVDSDVDADADADADAKTTLEPEHEWNKNVIIMNNNNLRYKYYFDLIDPCSGYPAATNRGSSLYSEVDGMSTVLRYRIQQSGFCGMIVHPLWNTSCYPSSIFTTAPACVVKQAFVYANSKMQIKDDAEREKEESKAGLAQERKPPPPPPPSSSSSPSSASSSSSPAPSPSPSPSTSSSTPALSLSLEYRSVEGIHTGRPNQCLMMTRSKNNSNISNDTSTHTEKAHQPINADTNTDTGATTDTPRAREKVLLFFPGDIQNTREQMQKLQLALPLPIDAPFIDKFCLESVTEGLARKFPECDRVVTVPASNVFDGFSVYSNFLAVHPQFGGVSTYFPQSCTAQLVSLLLNAGIVSVKEGQRNDGDGGGARSSSSGSSSNSDSNSSNNGIDAREPNVNNSKETKSNKPKKVYTNQLASVYEGAAELKFPELVLVGFSKGVIVLNQLLAELSAVNGRHLALSKRVFNHVTELYYLDGGNGAPTHGPAFVSPRCLPAVNRNWQLTLPQNDRMYDHDGRDYTDDAIRMEKGQTRSNGNEYQRRIHIYSSPWLARYVPELEAFVDALTRSNNSSIGTVGGEFKDDNNYGTCDGKNSIEEEAKKHKAASISVSVSRMFTELTARSSPAEKIYKHFQVLTSFQR